MTENDTIKEADAEQKTEGVPIQDVIEPNVNTDGRQPYEWMSKYPSEARTEMRGEAIYIGSVLAVSLLGLLLNWCGVISCLLGVEESKIVSFEGTLLLFRLVGWHYLWDKILLQSCCKRILDSG